MEWVEERHPSEPEYHQAVRGVASHLLGVVRDNKDYREQRILQRLTEPDRIISFRVVHADDNDVPQIHRGYRVQHSNALGPYKGGLRFDPSVKPAILKFLAFEQLFKNSLTGLNLGAAKGGADFNPKGKSDGEVMRFCQSFMTELARHIGQMTDVPAGDIGVGAREIGYLFGQYKRLENQFSGVLTGKSVGAGGSEMRTEATGYGAIYFLQAMLAEHDGDIEGQRIAISGAGNVALHAAEKASLLGGVVISLSNREGVLVKDDGLSCEDVQDIKKRYADGEGFGDIASEVGGRFEEGSKPWELECDIAIPAATQNELDEDDAKRLVDAGVKAVVEAANMPLTAEAERVFDDAEVAIAPGKAANAGGVAISGLEMSQNRLGRSWSKGRMDDELREIMSGIFERTKQHGQFEGRINYRCGADRAGFDRVAKAVSSFGIM
jgi:glutamate dehydrogenase (NADP+)